MKRDEYLSPMPWSSPYMSSLIEYDGQTLLALTVGQNPAVNDRYCPDVYVVESTDMGKTWKKRGVVASDSKMLNGYGGDGAEVSLCKTKTGRLLCVMRMEMSIMLKMNYWRRLWFGTDFWGKLSIVLDYTDTIYAKKLSAVLIRITIV